MMRQRVYIDTSVIGGCLDKEWQEDSSKLMQAFENGKMIPVLSNLTVDELLAASRPEVRALLKKPELQEAEMVQYNEEAYALAHTYIDEGVLSKAHLVDAQHIATATVHRVDVLVSWNFKDIVNLRRIQLFNAVNLKRGYPLLEIRSPKEVLSYEN